jgi:hypothetical protein
VTTRSGTNPNHGNVHSAIAIPKPIGRTTTATATGIDERQIRRREREEPEQLLAADLRELPQTRQLLIREHPRRHETDLLHQLTTLGAKPTSNRPSPQTEPGFTHRQLRLRHPLVFRRLLPEPRAGPTGVMPGSGVPSGPEYRSCSGRTVQHGVGAAASCGNGVSALCRTLTRFQGYAPVVQGLWF